MTRAAVMLALLLALAGAGAGQLDLYTFNNLRRGMPESEVLLRAGPPDLVTAQGGTILARDWDGTALESAASVKRLHYLPGPREHDPQLTIVTVTHGRVSALERRKVFSLAAPPAPAAGVRPRSDEDVRRERADRTLKAAQRYAEIRARIKSQAGEAPAAAAPPVYRGTDAGGNAYFGDAPPGDGGERPD